MKDYQKEITPLADDDLLFCWIILMQNLIILCTIIRIMKLILFLMMKAQGWSGIAMKNFQVRIW